VLLPSSPNNQAVVTYHPSHLRLLPNIDPADGVPFHSEVAALDAFAKSLDLAQDLLSKHHHHLWRRHLSVYKLLARGQPGKVDKPDFTC